MLFPSIVGKKYLKIKTKNVIMLERAWLEAKERYTVTVERNQDYLKWRFRKSIYRLFGIYLF